MQRLVRKISIIVRRESACEYVLIGREISAQSPPPADALQGHKQGVRGVPGVIAVERSHEVGLEPIKWF
jgi:hypothetical protein